MRKFVVLAGNIGAGKSSLVALLAEALDLKPYYEPVAENPYLADFYQDMERWAFPSQVFFLMHRVGTHRDLAGERISVVQDRSLYEDAEIFARNLYNQGAMSARDWETYHRLYTTVASLLPTPDLIVYLRASVPTLQKRIAQRGRDFEAAIPQSYLEGLNGLYESWIGNCSLAPVLVVDGDRYDFVARAADRAAVVRLVEDKLRDPQGLLF